VRYFLLVFIVFLIMTSIDILTTINKRSRAGEMLVYVKCGSRALLIFNLIGTSIVALLYLWIFYKRLNRLVSVLYPQYLDKWYQIFNYRLLEEIREGFVEKGMLHESITVERFTDSGLFYLMLFILWIIITCTYAYDYFGKKGICDRAIFLGRSFLYCWNKISCYEWGEQCNKRNRKYRKLAIFVNNGKLSRWLTGNDTMKVNLMVNMEDYEKAEGILRDKMLKCG